MSRIDTVIENLRATVDALSKARAAADEAELPPDEVIALENTQSSLRATIDRLYDLAMTRGLPESTSTVRKIDFDPSRTRERRTED